MKPDRPNFFILGNGGHFCHIPGQTKRLNVKMQSQRISSFLQSVRTIASFLMSAARALAYCAVILPAVLLGEELYSDFLNLSDFQIASIKIEGNHLVSREEILGRMGISAEDNLMNIDLEEKARALLEISNIRTVEVVKIFPCILKVSVTERDPVFVSGEKGYLLDSEGVKLPFDPGSYNVPAVLGFHYNREGNIDSDQISLYRSGVEALQEFYHISDYFSSGIKSLAVSKRCILVTFFDDRKVKLPLPFSERHFRRLIFVSQDLSRQNIPYKSIDLTFENVVVQKEEDEVKKIGSPRKSENSGKI